MSDGKSAAGDTAERLRREAPQDGFSAFMVCSIGISPEGECCGDALVRLGPTGFDYSPRRATDLKAQTPLETRVIALSAFDCYVVG